MQERTLARRYAKGLFEAARDRNALDRTQEELRLLAPVLEERETVRFLNNPCVALAEKQQALQAALGRECSPLVMDLMELLAQRRRLKVFPLVVEIFGELLDSAPTVSVAADIPVSPAVTAASLGASKVPAVADSGTGARNARQGTVAALSRGLPNTNSLESLQNSERAGKLSPTAVIDGRSWLSGNLYAAHL